MYLFARSQLEHSEQVALFEWIEWRAKQDERFLNIFAIPNGGQRNVVVAARLKAEGVKAGVPDLFVAVRRPADPQPSHLAPFESAWRYIDSAGLFIEMKVKPNTLKAHQRDWLNRLSRAGYMTAVCWSFEDARTLISAYFGTTLE